MVTLMIAAFGILVFFIDSRIGEDGDQFGASSSHPKTAMRRSDNLTWRD